MSGYSMCRSTIQASVTSRPQALSAAPLLPHLCQLPVLLAVLFVTELVVILYVFSLSPLGTFNWQRLSLLSLYAQWISLLSVGGLCHLGPRIHTQGDDADKNLSAKVAGLFSFGWIIGVTLLTNIGAQWVYAGGHWAAFSIAWLTRDVLIIGVLAAIILRYFYIQQSWRAEQKARQGARLEALHARIRPHFLFNSMNTIASLISYAPEDAEKAVEDLAALFRASLSQSDSLVSWQQELDICLAYVRIEQQRLGYRLQLDWQLSDIPKHCQLPPLSLQPLIENAIYHGVERSAAGGAVVVRAQVNDNELRISVENLYQPSRFESLHTAAKAHNGMAIDNIRARLAAIYHGLESNSQQQVKAQLILNRTLHLFIATLILPINLPVRASIVDGE